MLSANRLKYYRSLALKKKRDEDHVFIAEGPKLVGDLLPYFEPVSLLVEPKYEVQFQRTPVEVISEQEMTKISLQNNPQGVYAIFKRRLDFLKKVDPNTQLVLALDDIQDPGNLGTIIRVCDWFGIKHIVCSAGTVDVYNPKVVQASMGALGRISVYYTNLSAYLSQQTCPVYGAALKGKVIYREPLGKNGLIVMGNEGNGISPQVQKLLTHKLLIPSFCGDGQTSESLNVATATAIICSEFQRRTI